MRINLVIDTQKIIIVWFEDVSKKMAEHINAMVDMIFS